jgi:hypothetical protein
MLNALFIYLEAMLYFFPLPWLHWLSLYSVCRLRCVAAC